MRQKIRRPVDISKTFRNSGMTLITDPASDRYLNASSKLATSLQEKAETHSQTTSDEST